MPDRPSLARGRLEPAEPRSDAFHSLVAGLTRPLRSDAARRSPARWQERAPWLDTLAPRFAQALDSLVEVRALAAGEALQPCPHGHPGWIGVVQGCLSTPLPHAAARHAPLRAVAPGAPAPGLPAAAWYGEQELLLGSSPPRVAAAVDSQVAVLPGPVFRQLLVEQPAFGRWVLQAQARRVAALQRRLTWPRRPSPDAVVALWLAELFATADGAGAGDHRVTLTQAALSRVVGLSRQRTNAALNRLRRLGELDLAYADIRLRHPERLAQRALCGDFG